METWKILTAKRKQQIQTILDTHEKYKGSYFWTPYRNEASVNNSLDFEYQGHRYEVQQSTSPSRRNIYYSLDVVVDSSKKDMRALKRILKELT